ncbi:MAG: 16S rRNA (uracil(1498)-N(3))-methyltransferase [Actinomycetota bacterium]
MLSVFLVDSIPESGSVNILGDEAHHAASVVRVHVGDEIIVTDGRGTSATVRVLSSSKKALECEVLSKVADVPSQVRLSVLQALTKSDRARETIKLLTEAGVDEIVPWSAQRSIGQWKDDAGEKWKIWAREATKQSRRSWIPEITSHHNTSAALELAKNFPCVLIFHEGSKEKLSTYLNGALCDRILLIIGPEGGLTNDEVDRFVSVGGKIVGMGKPVFRSAHAGAAALAAVQTALGIW